MHVAGLRARAINNKEWTSRGLKKTIDDVQ